MPIEELETSITNYRTIEIEDWKVGYIMATVKAEVFTETYLHRGQFYYSRKIQVERSRYRYTGDSDDNLLDADKLLKTEIITIEE